jgi:hypothetical protein
MNVPKTESKRVKKFRLALAKETPKFPNDKATKQLLEQKSLTENLIINMTWRVRYVSNRPRDVQNDGNASSDPRWTALKPGIDHLLNKVKAGGDLTPHLSLMPHTRGFTPAQPAVGQALNWSDKDLLLNATGFHHFHLGTTLETAGHIQRTDDVMFAAVSREHFYVIGIFDHKVFDEATTNAMPTERAALWQASQDFLARSGSSIGGVGGLGVSASGHPTVVVLTAQKYFRLISKMDTQLDDPQFVEKLYKTAKLAQPKKPNFTWALNHLDLGVQDSAKNFFSLAKWPL